MLTAFFEEIVPVSRKNSDRGENKGKSEKSR
jgi:hypothetical protein